MANSLIKNAILLITVVTLVNANGELDEKPAIPANLMPILPEIENFSKLEARLENITDDEKIYQRPVSDRNEIFKKLLRMQEVRRILEECRKFHQPIDCSETKYRTVDGSCNNLKHPELGKAITQQRSLLPANYEGTNGFRKSVSGKKLPNTRGISLTMRNSSNPSTLVSALFTFFGQFITHDMTLTPVMTENGVVLDCCDPTKASDPFCDPIDISVDDPFYSQFNFTCHPFNRAAPYPKCNFAEKRGVINKKSSFIDASPVYDNTEEKSKKLRTSDGTGRLRTEDSIFGKLLPRNQDKEALFCPFVSTKKCFEGGDDRTNQHSTLVALQTVFLRLHNKIADSLHQLNHHWDGENIYQETRRMVVALLQHVVYNEYLMLLVGPDNMKKYDLYPNLQTGSLYNDEVDPSVLTEFSGAAFRPHSMIPTYFSGNMPRLKFRNTYFNFYPIRHGRLDSLLSGTCEVPSENNDEFQAEDISNYMYKAPGDIFGGDITLFDIQRGRDLGLPTYLQMVDYCFHGYKIQDFFDLSTSGLMTEKNARELMKIYDDVRDIDLLVGLLREVRGEAAFGPTAACIASIQFYRVKFGDSFYYTHTNGRSPFSTGQFETIRSYSLARIMCETTNMEKIRKNSLRIPSINNPLLMCKSFPPMDLSAWKEPS